jgi:hypothetical protein
MSDPITDADETADDADVAVTTDDLTITRYEVPIQLNLRAYSCLEQIYQDVRATVANVIVAEVDDIWRDDEYAHEHVRNRVEFDEAHVRREFEFGEADALEIQTVTTLGTVSPE